MISFFNREHLKGNISGSISVVALSIPLALGTGLIAFAPLGAEWAPHAIIYALIGLVFTGMIPVFLRGNPIQYYSLSTASAVLLADFLISAKRVPEVEVLAQSNPETYFTILLGGMALCIFLSGVFNVIFGLLRLGAIIKLFPQPVLAGAINGIGILIISKEVENWLPRSFEQIVPLILIIIVAVVAIVSHRKAPVFPASITALIFGGIVYWLIDSFTPAETGGIFGVLEMHPPYPDGIKYAASAFSQPVLSKVLTPLVANAFLIAILTSISTLVSVATLENITLNREDGSKVLLKLGAITILGSFFMALPIDGSESRTRLNYSAGGRNILSPIIFIVLCALFATVLSPYTGLVPKAIISGLVIYMSILLFDSLSLKYLPGFFKLYKSKEDRPLFNHLLISLFTAAMTLAIGFLPALLAGLSLALFFFLLESQSKIIYRKTCATEIPSKTVRKPAAMQVLKEHGDRIQVLELQGAMFFGSIDALTKVIEGIKNDVDFLILDFKRVSFSDSSAAMVLKRLLAKFKSLDKEILFAQLNTNSPAGAIFQQFNLFSENGKELYPTLNEARTYAEDKFLFSFHIENARVSELPVRSALLFDNLSDEEIAYFEKRVLKKTFKNGEIIINEGDESDGIYIIAKGRAVVQKITEDGTAISIVRFGPGVSVGEAALLTGARRSATVCAEGNTSCYLLPTDLLAAMKKENPNLMIKILINIGSAIARRLSAATNTIKELEQ